MRAYSQDLRDRVLRAIAELGYRRNSAARALVTRRSGLIGVIVDELPLYGPASTVTGIAEAARAAGYGVTLDPLFSIDGSTLAVAIEHHLSQSVEAIVLVWCVAVVGFPFTVLTFKKYSKMSFGFSAVPVPAGLGASKTRMPMCLMVTKWRSSFMAQFSGSTAIVPTWKPATREGLVLERGASEALRRKSEYTETRSLLSESMTESS